MALKGTTTIELTNVKTGEVERYEEENMVTTALSQLYASIGNLKLPTDCTSYTHFSEWNRASNDYEPAYSHVLGGIVLWNNQIPENENTITQPKTVEMVGCASCNLVNATTSSCRGNYNAAESYLTNSSSETSMKFVYDFATNQANGTINSLSLTSWIGGFNGFGGNNELNDFSYSSNVWSNGLLTQTTRPYKLFYGTSSYMLYIDPEEDVFYEVGSITTTTLKIYKCRANINSRSIFTNMYQNHKIIDTITIKLPTTLTGTNTWIVKYDSDYNRAYVIVSPTSSSVKSNETFYVIAINMDDYSVIVNTMTNKLGTTMEFSRYGFTCYNDYLYYAYNSAYVRKIKMSDSTYQSIYSPTKYTNSDWGYPLVINGMVYYRARYQYINTNGNTSTSTVAVCIDPETNAARATGFSDVPTDHYIPIKNHPLFYYRYYSNTTQGGVQVYYGRLGVCPLYLATINNLSRAIEKTSDKTMKITYTIQEV